MSFDSRRNINAATAYNVFYSTDGSVFSTLGSGVLSGTSYEAIQADNGGTPISDLTGTIDFRIYASGWSGSADENQNWYNDNVTVNGTVSVVPEPASVLLIGLGSGFIFLFRKLKAGFGLL